MTASEPSPAPDGGHDRHGHDRDQQAADDVLHMMHVRGHARDAAADARRQQDGTEPPPVPHHEERDRRRQRRVVGREAVVRRVGEERSERSIDDERPRVGVDAGRDVDQHSHEGQ